jgi:hypothetical protein
MHGIKVLMAKNYVDNLSEEVKKGQCEKAATRLLPEQGHVQIPSEAADWIAEGLRELGTSAEESHRHACGLLNETRLDGRCGLLSRDQMHGRYQIVALLGAGQRARCAAVTGSSGMRSRPPAAYR